MRKTVATTVMLSLLLLAVPAAADSPMSAVVVRIDGVCRASFDGLVAVGDVRDVLTSNGKWKLSCAGDIVEGTAPSTALVVRSTEDDPVATCNTPYAVTHTSVTVFTPSGKWSMACHGDITP